MSTIRASAPGKILLTGEYAVLFGAPAVVAAVDCRAEVSLCDSDKSVLHTRGYKDGHWPFSSGTDGIVFSSADDQFSLFEAAYLANNPRRPLDIELDTRAFADPVSSLKYGLGSSAALTVALVAALNAGSSTQDLLQMALTCHRNFQGGIGSGADIAAAVCGGVIEYRMGAEPISTGLPADLQLQLFWSGQPASTTGKVSKLQQGLGDFTAEAALQRLLQAAGDAAEHWRNGVDVLAELSRYTGALRGFDDAHDVGIFAAGHDRLHDHAAELGLLYKPCGAGGGDIGVLFTLQGEDTSGFERFAAERGFRRLDHRPGDSGVKVRKE